MQYKSIMTLRKEQERRLKRLGLLLGLLKVIAIAIILWLIAGCSTQSERIKNNCIQTASTYGEFLECAIILDELQR